jgi:phospholipid-binding lipoprotein MlaA
MRNFRAALTLALGLLAAGCASTSGDNAQLQNDAGDPLEGWNRQVFAMNEHFDHAVLKPVAEAYVAVVPEPARTGVHNFLANLNSPVVFANDVLQGEIGLAGDTAGRFGLNSTLGLGGIVDVATPAGIPNHSADFGQTLGVWGVGDDPYLVVPLLGPSDPRDLVGYGVDSAMFPLNYAGIRDYSYWAMGRGALAILDARARNLATFDQLEQTSVDPYASTRSLYRQYRRAHIRHGKSDVKNLPPM